MNLPAARLDETAYGAPILYVSPEGVFGFRSLTGEPAIYALVEEIGEGPLVIRADAALPGKQLARLLTQLRADGIKHIDLTVTGGT